jgi:hypothetical protein
MGWRWSVLGREGVTRAALEGSWCWCCRHHRKSRRTWSLRGSFRSRNPLTVIVTEQVAVLRRAAVGESVSLSEGVCPR